VAHQAIIRELAPGAPFIHVHDEGTKQLQPERVFRVVAFRASTVIVENAVGVRSSMSKKTRVHPLAATAWPEGAARQAETGEKAAG